jgi:hypothetical protein
MLCVRLSVSNRMMWQFIMNYKIKIMSEQKSKTRIDLFNSKQQKAFTECLASVKGLSYKEAEQLIYELLSELKNKAVIKT